MHLCEFQKQKENKNMCSFITRLVLSINSVCIYLQSDIYLPPCPHPQEMQKKKLLCEAIGESLGAILYISILLKQLFYQWLNQLNLKATVTKPVCSDCLQADFPILQKHAWYKMHLLHPHVKIHRYTYICTQTYTYTNTSKYKTFIFLKITLTYLVF